MIRVLLIAFILLVVLILIFRQFKIIRIATHISKYSVSKESEFRHSFFESLFREIIRKRNQLGASIKKSRILKASWPKYEKMAHDAGNVHVNGPIVIANKIFYVVLFVVIMLVTSYIYLSRISITLVLLAGLIGSLIPDHYYIFKKRKRLKEIDENIINAISTMNSSFRSGHSISQAVLIVSNELDGFIGHEFKLIYRDISLGLGIGEAFNRFAMRAPLEETQLIASTVGISSQLGGDVIKVFESIELSILNRHRIVDEVNALTSSARSTGNIMIGIPFFLIVLIHFLHPTFFSPLFQSQIGYFLIFLIVSLDIVAFVIFKQIMKVEL